MAVDDNIARLSTEDLREAVHLFNRIEIDMGDKAPHCREKGDEIWWELINRKK